MSVMLLLNHFILLFNSSTQGYDVIVVSHQTLKGRSTIMLLTS